MSCDTPTWVATVFPWVAMISAMLSIDVMANTEHDEINKRDPRLVQWMRRIGFIVMASTLGFAMYFVATTQAYLFWTSMFAVFVSGTYSLAVNDLALRLRRRPPPRFGDGVNSRDEFDRYSSDFIASTLREIRKDMRRFGDDLRGIDRGQLLTHLILQEVLLDLKLKPDPAKVESATILHPQWHKKSP